MKNRPHPFEGHPYPRTTAFREFSPKGNEQLFDPTPRDV